MKQASGRPARFWGRVWVFLARHAQGLEKSPWRWPPASEYLCVTALLSPMGHGVWGLLLFLIYAFLFLFKSCA